jgi:cell division protein FtsB
MDVSNISLIVTAFGGLLTVTVAAITAANTFKLQALEKIVAAQQAMISKLEKQVDELERENAELRDENNRLKQTTKPRGGTW